MATAINNESVMAALNERGGDIRRYANTIEELKHENHDLYVDNNRLRIENDTLKGDNNNLITLLLVAIFVAGCMGWNFA